MLIADLQLRLASLALKIDQVRLTIGNKRIRASAARVWLQNADVSICFFESKVM